MYTTQIAAGLPPIQVIGLCMDIIGALCIAAPDIPRINTKFRGGRLREARAMLETSGISHAMTGFEDLLDVIRAFPDTEIGRVPEIIRINNPVDERTPEEWQTIYGHYRTEGDGPLRRERFVEVPYQMLRLRLREEIRRSESRIRLVGFAILALGFMVQIWGVL